MIYYPLSTLMMAGINDILIITTPHDQEQFKRALGDGTNYGIKLSWGIQKEPKGIAEAFIIAKDFIGKDKVALILGDNIFYGNALQPLLKKAVQKDKGCTLFGYEVKDPARYGVAEIDRTGKLISLEEKPKHPKSSIAVTGLYFYDNRVIEIARSLKPSARGELEITDVNRLYMEKGEAQVTLMGRGFAWLDAGTYESLMQSSQFVQVIEERQGHYIAALEEVAFRQGFIDRNRLRELGEKLGKSPYGHYLIELSQKEIL